MTAKTDIMDYDMPGSENSTGRNAANTAVFIGLASCRKLAIYARNSVINI